MEITLDQIALAVLHAISPHHRCVLLTHSPLAAAAKRVYLSSDLCLTDLRTGSGSYCVYRLTEDGVMLPSAGDMYLYSSDADVSADDTILEQRPYVDNTGWSVLFRGGSCRVIGTVIGKETILRRQGVVESWE